MPPKFKRHVDAEERVELLSGGSSSSDDDVTYMPRQGGNKQVTKVQKQLDDVVGVMHQNIQKMVARGDKLEDLQDRSEDLADSAASFRAQARRIQRQMWWRRCRSRLILAVVVLVILGIIIIPIIVKSINKS
ncbi:vesicle-associated membrane protein 4-like [Oscarella lobularis]|uniref:vesicle-associated membrane protein 4-like n=1 Tax=Oscarella lobularis TaxID=121494 RepID=UPI0033143141